MIKFVADSFEFLFTILCFVVFAALFFTFLGGLGLGRGGLGTVLTAGLFIISIVLMGSVAVILDIRRLLGLLVNMQEGVKGENK